MLVEFTSDEVEALRKALQGRIDRMLMEVANTASRDYKAALVEEEGLLEGVLTKLGCSHAERSLEAACSAEV